MKNILLLGSMIFSLCSVSHAQTKADCKPAVPADALFVGDTVLLKTLVPMKFESSDFFAPQDHETPYYPSLGWIVFQSWFCSPTVDCKNYPGYVEAGTVFETYVKAISYIPTLRAAVDLEVRVSMNATPVTRISVMFPNISLQHTTCNYRTQHYIHKSELAYMIKKGFKKSVQYIQ